MMIDEKTPLVSVCCLAYNHAPYIRQCLDGFMMQKCDFPFEVLIHDDASTDGTADVIREYEAKYPDIIKPIYQTENQYSKGVGVTRVYQFPRAKGKYIALCEGDDYWTDPNKLQRQVDFLEAHEDVSMCFHDAKTIDIDGNNKGNHRRYSKDQYVPIEDMILNGGGFCPTASLVFRTKYIKSGYPDFCQNFYVGDYPLQLYLLAKGKVYYFDNEMSVYRTEVPGSYSQAFLKIDYSLHMERIIARFNMLDKMKALFDYKYSSTFRRAQVYIVSYELVSSITSFKYRKIKLMIKTLGLLFEKFKLKNKIIIGSAILFLTFKLFLAILYNKIINLITHIKNAPKCTTYINLPCI